MTIKTDAKGVGSLTVFTNGITRYIELSHPDEHMIYRAVQLPSDSEGVLRLHYLDIRISTTGREETYAKHGDVWVELLPENGGPKIYDLGTPEADAFEALLTQPVADALEYGRQILRQEGVLYLL